MIALLNIYAHDSPRHTGLRSGGEGISASPESTANGRDRLRVPHPQQECTLLQQVGQGGPKGGLATS